MAPTIEIEPDHHFKAKTYTSGATVTGHVSILTDHELPFDHLDVSFVGVAQKRLELAQLYAGKTSDWAFLKQTMPVKPDSLPQPRVFRPRQKYRVPFHFVIPQRLTPDTCDHPCADDLLRAQHLRLPPTVGFWDADDMCPDMITIGYYIRAKVSRESAPGLKRGKLGEGKLMLKVIPVSPEEPPLEITADDDQFALSKTGIVRQNVLRNKIGEFSVAASQPRAVMISPDGQRTSRPAVHITLGFVPYSEREKPPQVKLVSGKVVANTYFGSSTLARWPHRGSRVSSDATPVLNYMITTSIFEQHMGELAWRRDCLTGCGSTQDSVPVSPSSSEDNDCLPPMRRPVPSAKYMAEISIPLSIPHVDKKFFLPTFYSCHFSRTYTLQLSICTGASIRSLKLGVPLQVGVEGVGISDDNEPWIETRAHENPGARPATDVVDSLPDYEDSLL